MQQNRIERESRIERAACRFAEARGWFQVKIERTNRRGFPDRMFCRAGVVIFVEFKSERGRLSADQVRAIAEMRAAGCIVWIISSEREAEIIFA